MAAGEDYVCQMLKSQTMNYTHTSTHTGLLPFDAYLNVWVESALCFVVTLASHKSRSFILFFRLTFLCFVSRFRLPRRLSVCPSVHLSFCGAAQIVIISWVYGMQRSMDNLADMGMRMNVVLRRYWWLVWVLLSPAGCVVSVDGRVVYLTVEFFSLACFECGQFNAVLCCLCVCFSRVQAVFAFVMTDLGATKFGDYIFPQWADSMGWMMGASTLAPFVIFVVVNLIRQPKVNRANCTQTHIHHHITSTTHCARNENAN